jgi:hypothetical protein
MHALVKNKSPKCGTTTCTKSRIRGSAAPKRGYGGRNNGTVTPPHAPKHQTLRSHVQHPTRTRAHWTTDLHTRASACRHQPREPQAPASIGWSHALKQRGRAFALVAVLVVLGVRGGTGRVLMERVVEAVAARSVRALAVQAVVAAVRSYVVVAVVAAVAEDPSSRGETGGRPCSRHR